VACGAPVDVHLPDIQAAGVSIAPGDKFTAGDYTVVITEISSGDPSGYIGTGYVEMRLVAEIVAKKIAVDFTNLVVNTCYEMAAGDVVTQYDPNWGGILDVDDEINKVDEPYENLRKEFKKISDLLESIKDELLTFPSDCEQKNRISSYVNDLEKAKDIILQNEEYSSLEKTELTNPLNAIISTIRDQLACTECSSNGRINASSRVGCVSPSLLSSQVNQSIDGFKAIKSTFDDKVSSEIDFKEYIILPDGTIEF
jgi:hypothetical protein